MWILERVLGEKKTNSVQHGDGFGGVAFFLFTSLPSSYPMVSPLAIPRTPCGYDSPLARPAPPLHYSRPFLAVMVSRSF